MAESDVFELQNEIAGHRRCSACKVSKPVAMFNGDSSRTSGLRIACKQCEAARSMRWRDANQDKVLNVHLRRKFGITLDDYNQMLTEQEGACAICGTKPVRTGVRRQGATDRLSVDHDHDTGVVRGLLCIPCNQGLGHFRDDPQILRLALRYLEERQASSG